MFRGLVPDDKSNIFRTVLFSLFPNVIEVELETEGDYRSEAYSLNLMVLLSVLADAKIPSSFQELRIGDRDQVWIDGAYSGITDITEKFFAVNFNVEKKSVVTRKKREWVVIKPCS